MCTRSSLAEYLVAQSGWKNRKKLHLLWVVLCPLGFPKLWLHKFSRIYVRNALLFVVSNNLVYTTSSTTKSRYFLQVFQVERGASMWSSNFLVEVTVGFGVLLAVVRNEARKSPRNPASRSVLKGAFDAKKHLLKNKMHGSIFFEVIWTLLHPPFIQLDLHL